MVESKAAEVPPGKVFLRGPYYLKRGKVLLTEGILIVLPLIGETAQEVKVAYQPSNGKDRLLVWKQNPILVPKAGCLRLEKGEIRFLAIQILHTSEKLVNTEDLDPEQKPSVDSEHLTKE